MRSRTILACAALALMIDEHHAILLAFATRYVRCARGPWDVVLADK